MNQILIRNKTDDDFDPKYIYSDPKINWWFQSRMMWNHRPTNNRITWWWFRSKLIRSEITQYDSSPKYIFCSKTLLIDRYKFQSKQSNNNNLPLLVSIPTTTTKIEEKYKEEIVLPCTLKIKFGEEYSSVYYLTIHVLLFYDNAKKRKCWRRNIFTSHTQNRIWGRV